MHEITTYGPARATRAASAASHTVRPRGSRTPGWLLVATALVVACGGRQDAPPEPTPPTAEPDPDVEAPAPPPAEPTAAPWSAAPLSPDEVPPEYLEAWTEAENRDACPLMAFRDPPVGSPSEPGEPVDLDARRTVTRAAPFGGGWGVAYDMPELRSAFGVAGTGVEPGPDTYDDWPHHVRWLDGSRAGYGPEGGQGHTQLAYLHVAGHDCLYNVWSRLGPGHVEALLEELRLVETAS